MKKALGKGLNALLPAVPANDGSAVVELEIGKIEPNPEQPRRKFDEEQIRELAGSIASVGVVQPIIVVDEGGNYRIVAGERRWRAAQIAGLETIPAIVRGYTREQGVEVALIENLQRQDLNPVEEASGYERLIKEYGYTQERIAKAVGKSRPAIANSVRLLSLSARIRDMITDGAISAGHARALLSIEADERRDEVADKIVELGLNVRQTEILAGGRAPAAGTMPAGDASADVAADVAAGVAAGVAADAASTGAPPAGNAGEVVPSSGGTPTGIPTSGGAVSGGIPTSGGAVSGGIPPAGAVSGGNAGEVVPSTGGTSPAGVPTSGTSPAGVPTSGTSAAGAVSGGTSPAGASPGGIPQAGVSPSGGAPAPGAISERDAVFSQIEDELRTYFNTRVTLSSSGPKSGKIIIEYYGDEGLQKLLEQLGISFIL